MGVQITIFSFKLNCQYQDGFITDNIDRPAWRSEIGVLKHDSFAGAQRLNFSTLRAYLHLPGEQNAKLTPPGKCLTVRETCRKSRKKISLATCRCRHKRRIFLDLLRTRAKGDRFGGERRTTILPVANCQYFQVHSALSQFVRYTSNHEVTLHPFTMPTAQYSQKRFRNERRSLLCDDAVLRGTSRKAPY